MCTTGSRPSQRKRQQILGQRKQQTQEFQGIHGMGVSKSYLILMAYNKTKEERFKGYHDIKPPRISRTISFPWVSL
jgi:hypothetical protein